MITTTKNVVSPYAQLTLLQRAMATKHGRDYVFPGVDVAPGTTAGLPLLVSTWKITKHGYVFVSQSTDTLSWNRSAASPVGRSSCRREREPSRSEQPIS